MSLPKNLIYKGYQNPLKVDPNKTTVEEFFLMSSMVGNYVTG